MKLKHLIFLLCTFSFTVNAATQMASDRISDIRNTKHNFASADEPQLPFGNRTVKATTENQVCVFCHTPHGDPSKVGDRAHFLWNRTLSSVSDKYTSSSMQASTNGPGQSSKMCLSCHDGTVAIGQVDVSNGRLSTTNIAMLGTESSGEILGSSNANLGTDLSNDHPIGFVYDDALATNIDENELLSPSTTDHIGIRVGGSVASFNTGLGGSPTTNDPTAAVTRIAVPLESVASFRANGQTSFVSVAAQGTVECTTCHDPHIRSTDNTENIKFLRLHRFQKTDPAGGNFLVNSDINCLACHKKAGWSGSAHASETVAPHIYTDAEATKREISSDKAVWQTSCLACHDTHTETGARWLLRKTQDVSILNSEVSDIDLSCYECHSSTGVLDPSSGTVADIQSITTMGGHIPFDANPVNTLAHSPINSDLKEKVADLNNRHAACSDCHNPHRLQKGIHANTGSPTDNDVSGPLTMISGLDASDSSGTFAPFGFEDTAIQTIATKEYQICFKCHSSFGHDSGQIGTGVNQFSNTVMEFSNTTSAHPVITGTATTFVDENTLLAPFNTKVLGVSGVGEQTMYCSDCHTNTDGAGNPISPQGSHNNDVAACETCHVATQYRDSGGAAIQSAFACIAGACTLSTTEGELNLHIFHASKAVGGVNVCTDCHVKVPHGWDRRSLLASNGNDLPALKPKYFPTLKIDSIALPPNKGEWTKASCTAAGCH